MGYYIQGPARGKGEFLMEKYGADIVSKTRAEQLINSNEFAVVCVVDNGPFEAAALCYDTREFEAFSNPSDYRSKLWMTMERAKAHELAGYPG